MSTKHIPKSTLPGKSEVRSLEKYSILNTAYLPTIRDLQFTTDLKSCSLYQSASIDLLPIFFSDERAIIRRDQRYPHRQRNIPGTESRV
jgi:hypothetical protein